MKRSTSTRTRGLWRGCMPLMLTVACCSDGARSAGPVLSAMKIAPPAQGMYVGIAERDPGDMHAFEHALGRRAPLFWPKPVVSWSREGVIDAETNFDPVAAQEAWDHGYLVMTGLEPHPENGMRVDDLLRGKYDEHLRRLAAQYEQFGKPMFFATAREPNIVLLNWKGGYGPEGNKSLSWALETEGATATAAFDPSQFPNSQLYEGLGDPPMDDGLERLAAAQRYYHDFFVTKEGLGFLTFATTGWAIKGDSWEDDGEVPPEIQVDFLTFYRMLGDTVDWISLNYYTLDATNAARAVEQNLAGFDAQIQAIRRADIGKPILITEFGLCGTDATRGAIITGVLEKIVGDYPEIAGFQVWNIGFAVENLRDKPCTLDHAIGFPELKQAMANHPDHFHSCPRFGDGSQMPTCHSAPSQVLPQVGCLDQCLQLGSSEEHCWAQCAGS